MDSAYICLQFLLVFAGILYLLTLAAFAVNYITEVTKDRTGNLLRNFLLVCAKICHGGTIVTGFLFGFILACLVGLPIFSQTGLPGWEMRLLLYLSILPMLGLVVVVASISSKVIEKILTAYPGIISIQEYCLPTTANRCN